MKTWNITAYLCHINELRFIKLKARRNIKGHTNTNT